jgi:preprotein translocase subunit SecA
MDYLREGIGLRAMAQRDPLVEYQREGFDMFSSMMDGIKEESVGSLFNLQFEVQENPIVEEVGAGAQLAFGGNLPGVTAGNGADGAAAQAAAPAPEAPARPARPARPVPPARQEPAAPPAAFGKKPSRGRHAADGRGHATAAGRGETATRSSAEAEAAAQAEVDVPAEESGVPQAVLPPSLEPRRPRNLQYSAPTEDGGVEQHGSKSDDLGTVGRNDPCPCGSGRKYKRCHGDPRHAG